jgi:hypothetical protein
MIPTIKLENLELCRFICGSNPFVGISHFTESRDMFYRNYFSKPETIAEIMSYLFEEFGVNAIVSSPRDDLYTAIQIVEKEFGEKYHWLCTPGYMRGSAKGLGKAGIFEQIDWCTDHNVSVCLPHRSYTDKFIRPAEHKIEQMPEICAYIRDHNMIPGLSTHYYETIQICKKQKYDVKLIIQPFNTLGFMSNIEVNTLRKSILGTDIQILNIKPLAAGRILPEVGLNFCYNNIKPNDFVTCGFSCMEDADYDAQIVENLLTKNS